ncbi:MAG: hypothetical protein GX318_05940 [Clostridia bacterium]|nr:hypothetical protein [Clostridia bacterium]
MPNKIPDVLGLYANEALDILKGDNFRVRCVETLPVKNIDPSKNKRVVRLRQLAPGLVELVLVHESSKKLGEGGEYCGI